MKTHRQHTRDRHEDRAEREEKLGQAMDTLPGKTLRDRAMPVRPEIPRSMANAFGTGAIMPRQKAPTQAKPAARPVAFSLTAPEAAAVHLAGSFNNWDPAATQLTKGGDGAWAIHLNLKPGDYEYRFLVDGVWQDDPAACEFAANPFGSKNCIRHVT